MSNRIHPTAVLGPGVELGSGNVVGPFALVLGPCRIGDDAWIAPHAVVGTPAEIRGHDLGAAWDGELVGRGVEIGDRTVVREQVTVHSGSGRVTRIGADCLLMTKAHVGHDADLGDGVTVASGALIGGHVVLGDRANVGLGAVVHQRRVVGPGAMVGMGSVVTRDVPPFATAFGSPARVQGVNAVGMGRQGMSDADVAALAELYGGGREVVAHWPPAATLAPALAWWRRHATGG